MPLQNIYRPDNFDDFIGNEPAVESLKSVFNRESDIPQAYLFTGNAGFGKTTLAFIIKNQIGCSDSDFYYYNAASTRGIGTVRDIIDNAQFMPMGNVKYFIMEEAHGITGPALDALLKFLEFLPKYTYFAFCTSEPEKWDIRKNQKNALYRRCHTTNLNPLSLPETRKVLNGIIKSEQIDNFSKEIIDKIADVCNGSPGMALSLLDKVIDIQDEKAALKVIEDATVSEANIVEIARLLLSGRSEWKAIATKIKGLTGEAESLRYAFLGYFQAVLLSKGTSDVAEVMTIFCDSVMYSGKPGLTTEIFFAYKALLK